MTVCHLSIASTSAPVDGASVILLAARAHDEAPELIAEQGYEAIADDLKAVGFRGGKDELVRLPGRDPLPASASIAVIGLGSERTPDTVRDAIGSAIRQLAGSERVTVAVPLDDDAELAAALEGAALGSYGYTGLRSATLDAVKPPVASVTVRSDTAVGDGVISRAHAVASAVALAKDLVNAPSSQLYPEALADAAIEAASGFPIDVTVWDETRLEQDGFGGIAGVGAGSARPPRLVKLSYAPADASAHIALIGKGITFDTGGISLKPPASMVGMKYDMAGAATVLATIIAAARLSLPVRVTAWMCIAENMPSGSAIKPNDVLRIRGGRTVEVLNTDAEGRLVMADGLAAASEEQPDAIVDVATLTGAAVVALGNRYAAVMGDDVLVESVSASAASAGELFWPMPLPAELRAAINSDVADIANAAPGNTAGGMLLAGVFLREFVGNAQDGSRIPWAHLDIAGPAQLKGSPYGFVGKGATGVAVRTLIALAEDFSHR
jgi:leucyl aminopeptidase